MAGETHCKGLESSGGSGNNPTSARTAVPPSERVPAAWLHLARLGTRHQVRCEGRPALWHSARCPASPAARAAAATRPSPL